MVWPSPRQCCNSRKSVPGPHGYWFKTIVVVDGGTPNDFPKWSIILVSVCKASMVGASTQFMEARCWSLFAINPPRISNWTNVLCQPLCNIGGGGEWLSSMNDGNFYPVNISIHEQPHADGWRSLWGLPWGSPGFSFSPDALPQGIVNLPGTLELSCCGCLSVNIPRSLSASVSSRARISVSWCLEAPCETNSYFWEEIHCTVVRNVVKCCE